MIWQISTYPGNENKKAEEILSIPFPVLLHRLNPFQYFDYASQDTKKKKNSPMDGRRSLGYSISLKISCLVSMIMFRVSCLIHVSMNFNIMNGKFIDSRMKYVYNCHETCVSFTKLTNKQN